MKTHDPNSNQSDSDERLLHDLAYDDELALATLMDYYKEHLLKFAYSYLHCLQDAEEVVGETFFVAWQRATAFRGESSVRSWLYSICRNLAVTRLRKRRRGFFVPLHHALRDTSSDADPESQAWQDYRNNLLQLAIQRLPLLHREALILRIDQQLTYKEIAAVCNCPIGTVRSRLNYALKRLNQLFRKMDVDGCLGEEEL